MFQTRLTIYPHADETRESLRGRFFPAPRPFVQLESGGRGDKFAVDWTGAARGPMQVVSEGHRSEREDDDWDEDAMLGLLGDCVHM